jgi:hypothetical protein
MKQLRKLNDSERASLYLYLIEGIKDWERVYCVAVGEERFNKLQRTANKRTPLVGRGRQEFNLDWGKSKKS